MRSEERDIDKSGMGQSGQRRQVQARADGERQEEQEDGLRGHGHVPHGHGLEGGHSVLLHGVCGERGQEFGRVRHVQDVHEAGRPQNRSEGGRRIADHGDLGQGAGGQVLHGAGAQDRGEDVRHAEVGPDRHVLHGHGPQDQGREKAFGAGDEILLPGEGGGRRHGGTGGQARHENGGIRRIGDEVEIHEHEAAGKRNGGRKGEPGDPGMGKGQRKRRHDVHLRRVQGQEADRERDKRNEPQGREGHGGVRAHVRGENEGNGERREGDGRKL